MKKLTIDKDTWERRSTDGLILRKYRHKKIRKDDGNGLLMVVNGGHNTVLGGLKRGL